MLFLSRLFACEEVLGYPSRSHPFTFTSGFDIRDNTIYHQRRRKIEDYFSMNEKKKI